MLLTEMKLKENGTAAIPDGRRIVRENRKAAGLTQEEFAIRSGLGLRFVHDLEQGKETVRLDKVNQALAMFGMEAVPGRIERKAEEDQP